MASVASVRLGQDQEQQQVTALSSLELGSFELVELASNPVLDGVLAPNRDGRVRNPVPSKLKGKTDNKKGNFSVMHMDTTTSGKKNEVQTRDIAAERDAAARRTSENTASRAKAAQQEKYVPPKKRIEDGFTRASHFGGREDARQRARPLTPDETKHEQARLLTLLRSINPVTVVDQICKAAAYFGGIPGALPPEDGIFPESANTRETGALFIGWLAEIFPDISRLPEEPAVQATSSGTWKKGRGRVNHKYTDNPNPANGYGYGQVPAPSWALPPSLGLVNTHLPGPHLQSGQVGPLAVDQNVEPEIQSPSTPVRSRLERTSPNTASAGKKKRGRPKGSRNKGKGDEQRTSDTTGARNTEPSIHDQTTVEEQVPPSLMTPGTTEKVAESTEPSNGIVASSDQTQSNQTLNFPEQQWQNGHQAVQGVAPVDELSPEERAVLEAFRSHGPQTIGNMGNMGTVAINESAITTAPPPHSGTKRKRAPSKPKASVAPVQTVSNEKAHSIQDASVLSAETDGTGSASKESVQWTSVDTSTTAPPAKRQRKPKACGSNEPQSRKNTASIVSISTPPTAPSTIPDSTATSQQSVPTTRPPAEGLEAHYERFTSLQQQQQQQQKQQQSARSKTPTVAPQQQLRQHQKTSSLTQNMPQHQQQTQQTNHSAQPNTAHDERSAAPARAPSALYNSRTKTTSYTQQYPSHQSTQQYGNNHQPSPQMSNSSYRTASSHTIAQPSPQFSPTENTYRTASPHTITQPTPSFSQSESTYSATATHSMAQPSQSYSQAEAPYRSSSSHTLAQQSASYPRRSSQSQNQSSHPAQQNQYGHFQESPFMDLPTLDSLGHGTSTGNANVNLSMTSTGGYGHAISGVGSSRSGSGGSLYSTSSGLNHAYDTGASDLLRASRSGSNTASYGATTGMSNSFDAGGSFRGLGRR